MDYTENEVTLGQLFKVVRKSFKRALIYMLVSLVIASALLFVVRAFTSTRSFSTAISFSSAQENAISVMNRNKSAVVNSALTSNGKDLSVAEYLTENLSISAVVPEDLDATEDFVATSFIISLRSTNKVSLSDNEYKSIVDSIAAEYINLFAISTLPSSVVDSYTLPENDSSVEYFQITDEIADNAQLFYNTLVSYTGDYPELASYRSSNGKTVADIINELSVINGRIASLQTRIVTGRHEKGNLEALLDALIATTSASVTSYTQQLESAKNALAEFPNFTIITDGTTPIDGSAAAMYEAYLSLQQDVTNYSELLSRATEKQETLNYYKGVLGASPAEDNSEIQADIEALNTALNGIITEYREIAGEHNENAYLTSQATVLNPAHRYTDSIISGGIIAIVLVAVALIAYIAAYTKTYGIMKKSGELYGKTEGEKTSEQN